jgi:hypothetical protein
MTKISQQHLNIIKSKKCIISPYYIIKKLLLRQLLNRNKNIKLAYKFNSNLNFFFHSF